MQYGADSRSERDHCSEGRGAVAVDVAAVAAPCWCRHRPSILDPDLIDFSDKRPEEGFFVSHQTLHAPLVNLEEEQF